MNIEIKKIKEISYNRGWYSISTNDSMGFGFKSKQKDFKIGDEVIMVTDCCFIKSLEIAGQLIYYKDKITIEADRVKQLAKMKLDREKRFKKEKPKLDKAYNNLPDVFKKRIDKFRTNNPDFRVEFESYEMMCCEEAVRLANHCKDSKALESFSKLDWEEQKKLIPALNDGHSGNSWGFSKYLAHIYLDNPENVIKLRGALSVLVGNEAYGDIPLKS